MPGATDAGFDVPDDPGLGPKTSAEVGTPGPLDVLAAAPADIGLKDTYAAQDVLSALPSDAMSVDTSVASVSPDGRDTAIDAGSQDTYTYIKGIQPGKCDYVTVVARTDRLGWTITNTTVQVYSPEKSQMLGPAAGVVSWTTGPAPDLGWPVQSNCDDHTRNCGPDDRLIDGRSCNIFEVLISPQRLVGQTKLIINLLCDIGWGFDGVLRDGTSEAREVDLAHVQSACVK